MRTYLYGLILSRNAHLLPARIDGIGGTVLAVVNVDDLAALVGQVDDDTSAKLDTVRAHDRVMRRIVDSGITAIPVRFGQTFRDEKELRRHLGDRARALTESLERMDGQVEMRLLMTLPEASGEQPKSSAPGRAYLESLRGSTRAAGLALRAALGPVVRGEHVEELPRDAGVAFAHLIERERESEYREAVAAHPSLRDATIVGPLALYAFGEE